MKNQAEIAVAMRRFGGSFVNGLGTALLHADNENARKIADTWPDLIERYTRMKDSSVVVVDCREENKPPPF